MCCNTFGSAFCAMTSVFLIAYMAFLGALIKKDYPFVGEWKDYHGYAENNDAHDTAMKCFTVAGIYGGTLVLSVIGLVYHGRKK